MTRQSAAGAPRELSLREAAELAAGEYSTRRGDRGWMLLSRGSDGGMHYRGSAYSAADASRWVQARVDSMARGLVAGELRHILFFDKARDRFYVA